MEKCSSLREAFRKRKNVRKGRQGRNGDFPRPVQKGRGGSGGGPKLESGGDLIVRVAEDCGERRRLFGTFDRLKGDFEPFGGIQNLARSPGACGQGRAPGCHFRLVQGLALVRRK